jgi:hypothetical protein
VTPVKKPRLAAPGRHHVRRAGAIVAAAAVCLLTSANGHAEGTNQPAADVLQAVLARLDKAEAEIKALKAELAARPANPVPTNAPAVASDGATQQRLTKDEAEIKNLQAELEAKDAVDQKPKYPNLQFHGFGDIDFAADSRKGGTIPYGVTVYGGKDTFFLGELDLFLTSQLAENVSVLNETVLSAGLNNEMGIDIERLYLEYRANDYFNVDAGRFHTALGYYNTTYHHGVWLENAVGRPSFLEFEDSGGILPVHMVGVSVHGAIPSGKLNLNYFVEAGNGLDYSSNPNVNQVQQVTSFGDSKAVNLAILSRPEFLPGLQFGGGVYYDSITPDLETPTNGISSLPKNTQFIFNSHVAYHNAGWEFMTEGYLIRDQPDNQRAHYSPAFFTQVSRKFGVFTPYARFTYYNVSRNDLLYTLAWDGGANAGVHYGPSFGVRYDFSNFAAFKLQYDYLIDTGLDDASRIAVQACFTF